MSTACFKPILAAVTMLIVSSASHARDGVLAGGSDLRLDLAGALNQPVDDGVASEGGGEGGGGGEASAGDERIPFGRAGSEWLILGGGYANDFYTEDDYNLHVAYACFLGDELEMAVEFGAWYFDQTGDNAFGVNGNVIFRWHFWHDADFDWSVYGDIGIGLLAGSDNVPDDGTGFDFTPRAGFGLTRRLNEDGLRLQLGVRWHHISNGRIEGDDRNPSRDSIMAYFGVMVPF